MKKVVIFLFLMASLASCRREQAFFQKSQPIQYESSKKNPEEVIFNKPKIEEPVFSASLNETFELNDKSIESETITELEPLEINSNSFGKERRVFGRRARFLRKTIRAERKFSDKVEEITSRKIFKSQKKRSNGVFDNINYKIKIGVVFLLISIILTLFNVKLLAIIFAIAAILYLAWGLKRQFR